MQTLRLIRLCLRSIAIGLAIIAWCFRDNGKEWYYSVYAQLAIAASVMDFGFEIAIFIKDKADKAKEAEANKQRKISHKSYESIKSLLETSLSPTTSKVYISYNAQDKESENLVRQINDLFISAGYTTSVHVELIIGGPSLSGVRISTFNPPDQFLYTALDSILKSTGQERSSVYRLPCPEDGIDIKIQIYGKP